MSTKMIILAAGMGTRLHPYTEDRPKCMVEFNEKPIIEYILEAASECGLTDISVVTGYKEESIQDDGFKKYHNPNFATTNMVNSLFCALSELNDEQDIIISYSDIIYNSKLLQELIDSKDDLTIVVDKKWEKLWRLRLGDNILSDAETLKLNESGHITELGKKTDSLDNINGQYIGLLKISKTSINKIVDYYSNLNRDILYDGKDFDNMYMTSFVQNIIDNLISAKALMTNGGWIEIDSVADLDSYNSNKPFIIKYLRREV
jgi:L-glutamine-phosphate cytidylyltransferase